MSVAPDLLTAFEENLERWIMRCADESPTNRMVQAHFGFGEADRRRGKRLRPHILLLVAQTEGARPGDADGAAIAIELLHNYSLIHDDIEDRDELRHGRPTLWVRYGIPSAIIAGNAMCAMSYLALISGSEALAAERRVAMERCLQTANLRMCEGQSRDIGFETAPFVTFDAYMKMIEGKTSALFSATCELGARAAGVDEERAQAYAAFGRAYGLAFQMRDDILGTWGTTAETGKPSGADIRRRKWSFPVVWALAGPPSEDRALIERGYDRIGELSDNEADAVIGALDRLGSQAAADDACDNAIAQAAELAADYDLDRDFRLRRLFEGTSRRRV